MQLLLLLSRNILIHIELNQISRDILRAVLLSESAILSDSDFDEPGKGTCLGSSPNCPLVASFRA
jgi:hypothetical protein